MAKHSKKYQLLIYERLINRWLEMVFIIGVVLMPIGWLVSSTQMGSVVMFVTPFFNITGANLFYLLGAGVLLFALFLFVIRKNAYVQTKPGYLHLVLPFFRMKISYKRIKGTRTSEVKAIFKDVKMSGLQRDTIDRFMRETAIIVDLSAYPMSRSTLNLFLSRFFFYDNTPHLVFIVKDWMGFSMELESARMSDKSPSQAAAVRAHPQAAKKEPVARGLLGKIDRGDKK